MSKSMSAKRALVGAMVVLLTPALSAQYTLDLTDDQGDVGEMASIDLVLDDPTGAALAGWSWGVCQSNTNVLLDTVEDGPVVAVFNGGSGPDFNVVLCIGPTGWAIGVVINFAGAESLLPGIDQVLNIVTCDLLAEGDTVLSFCGTLCAPPVAVTLVDIGGSSIIPTTEDGLITVAPVPDDFGFIRGDANGDGGVNGLIDGLFILNFGFVPGSPIPPCNDAADFDDDGSLNALIDGLGALSFGFIPGSPPPAAPFPNCCEDSTADDLDCVIQMICNP